MPPGRARSWSLARPIGRRCSNACAPSEAGCQRISILTGMKRVAGNFIDTNVLVYLASADPDKAARAEEIVARGGTISVQVPRLLASRANNNCLDTTRSGRCERGVRAISTHAG